MADYLKEWLKSFFLNTNNNMTIDIVKSETFSLFESNWLSFLLISMLGLLLLAASQHLLVSDELYFNALSQQMTFEQIQEILDKNRRFAWLTYIILFLYNTLKFLLVGATLSLGYYLATDRWMFKPFFRICVKAELVLILPGLFKLIWFLFVQTDYTLSDLQIFFPLSLLNLFEPGAFEPYLIYPLQVLNLFEVAYWFALAYGVARVMNASLERGFGLVMASYGSGLALWIVFIMFLTISFS
jgi:predicted nucleic acid-binding Zn ribbon protein